MNDRRAENSNEPIVDPDLPIIDAHFHLFDRPGMRFLLEDYIACVAYGHRIVGSVYVETLAFARTEGPELLRPLGEVEFAEAIAAQAATERPAGCAVAAAIVGHADLRFGSAVGELLDRSLEAAPERYRGIRQVALDHARDEAFRYIPVRPPRNLYEDPRFLAGFAELALRDLSFDAVVFDTQLDALAQLADAFPDTLIILNHLGFAMAIDLDKSGRDEVFSRWRKAMARLAERPNVLCKIGGMGLPPWGFGFENRTGPVGATDLVAAWRPYVETAIGSFGVGRCMMESDYPPDARSCGFVPLWNALKLCVAGASWEDKRSLFYDNAVSAYRLPVDL